MATPKRLSVNVTPGGSYTVPSDGVYVLTSISKGPANAWWLMDGIEFFGVNNGEACIPLWLKKGAKLTTRSGEGFSYVVRCVFQLSLSQITIYGGSSASFSTWMSGSVPGFEISMTISDGTKLIFQCTSTGALYATKKDGKQNLVWKIQPQLSLSQVFPVYQGGDLNERTSTCIVQCFHDYDTGNMPVASWGVCLVLRAGDYISQLYINNYDTNNARMWVRSLEPNKGLWTSWRALQHSLSQRVFDGLFYNDNLDNAPFGVSVWGIGCANSPSDYGAVLVFGRGDAYIFQIACVTYNIDGNSSILYVRRNINGTGYTTWRPVDQ